MERVLVIDDDVGLCELVKEYLGPEGYDVEVTHNGRNGASLEPCLTEHAVSDSGCDAAWKSMASMCLRRIRSRSRIPVLMLTARGDDVRIASWAWRSALTITFQSHLIRANWWPASGLSCGARNPVTRCRADARICWWAISRWDIATRTVRRAGDLIELTVVEYDLFEKLLRSTGQIAKREDLVKEVLVVTCRRSIAASTCT